MKKHIYRVQTKYTFEGVFEVLAESKQEAQEKVLQDCGLVMGGGIHSTLPDEHINWAFSTHPDTNITQITLTDKE